jgi:hypothetical protein
LSYDIIVGWRKQTSAERLQIDRPMAGRADHP